MARTSDWNNVGSTFPPKKTKRPSGGKDDRLPSGASHGSLFSGRARVSAVYYRSDDFLAGKMSGGDGTTFGFVLKRKGNLSQVKEGTELDLRGTWVTSKFGLQVDISSFDVVSQDERWGFVNSLTRFIPKRRRTEAIKEILFLLWDDFGPDVEKFLSHKKGVTNWPVLMAKGYKHTVEMSIITEAARLKGEKEAKVKVIGDLKGMGVRGKVAERMFAEFGEDCVPAFKESPYAIAIEYGLKDFDRIDDVGKRAGISATDIDRLKLAVVSTMEDIRDSGHCSISADDLIRIVGNKLGVDEDDEMVMDALDACAADVLVVVEEDDQVYPYDLHESECIVARNVVVRQMHQEEGLGDDLIMASKMIPLAAEELGIEYTKEQHEAVLTAWSSPISVITGGPGTGKTTVCKAIVSSLEASGHEIALCCPTGRGAKKLSETVGKEAMTIHRLVGYDPNQESWEHDLSNQLPFSAIIIDESSMVDIDLMRVLMDATAGFSRLVLVGDYDQLPSVGPGRLLRDIIESGLVPVTRLNHIFRQKDGSDIIGVSHDVRMGIVPSIDPLSSENLDEGMCSFYQCDDARILADKIPNMVKGLAKVYGIDPLEVQVLTPMRVGPLGTDALNQILQGSLNPPGEGECPVEGRVFRIGDKVMQVRNDYDRGIFNGDSGKVVDADDSGIIVRFDGGWLMAYDRYDIPYFLIHYYATTIHRSQGSEFPAGVVVMHDSHRRMLQRNLLYTGISRFKRAAIICGQRAAMRTAVNNDTEESRNTGLKARMEDTRTVLKGMS